MSLEAIWDAAAKQAALVSGIKGAYSAAASDPAAKPFREDLADTPVVEVIYDGTVVEAGSSEVLVHQFTLRVWMSRTDVGTGTKVLAPMFERFITAFRQNIHLFDTANGGANITGSGPFTPFDSDDNKPFLYQDITLRAAEKRTVSYTG